MGTYNMGNFFSGFGSSSSGISGLGGLLSDYNAIRNGSYGKLMKAYYGGMNNTATKAAYSKVTKNDDYGRYNTSTAKDSATTIKELQSTTDKLTASAKELYSSGSKSVFNKVDVKDEDGNVVKDSRGVAKKQYDVDKIYKSVKGFVDNYNSVLDAADKSADTKVQNSVIGMINYTKMESNMLGKLGITIGSDYKLSIDEDAFKKADMNVAKSLFNGTGSYAYTIGSKSAMANNYADLEASRANTYNRYGSYGSAYNSGSIYNNYF